MVEQALGPKMQKSPERPCPIEPHAVEALTALTGGCSWRLLPIFRLPLRVLWKGHGAVEKMTEEAVAEEIFG